MKYTVVWRPAAERALAEIWTHVHDRNKIIDAANSIDAHLFAFFPRKWSV